jgi:SAM-dependent methyltransferase
MLEILHVGSGDSTLPANFAQPHRETRLDVAAEWGPDIVADMADLPDGIGPFDAVYGSHCIEHLPFHKIQPCLKGWLNVLKPGGVVIQLCPDLEGVEPNDDVLYLAEYDLPVRGRDLFYGHSDLVAIWPAMQHLSGFTAATLRKQFETAGFIDVIVSRSGRDGCNNLLAIGVRPT